MKRHILKEQFSQAIGNRKVLAALFYTFNFDPVFFENYVMPLLVPEKKFKNEQIYNTILWRRCAKEGLMPAITVYCDHYAKDGTTAPTLGYEMRCIRLPAASKVLVNFHPKESWILLDDGTLLQFNGSANITQSGWCENLECVSLTILTKNQWPKTSKVNQKQRVIQGIASLSSQKKLSDAELKIFDFLKYTDPTTHFFSSIEVSFEEVLSDLITVHGICSIEIISPYMYGEANLISFLQQRGVAKIFCLIPALKNNEVLLSRETFEAMKNKGVVWCNWTSNEVNDEPRNLHAKMYRLYGVNKTITITGSINFTNPAWKKLQPDRFNQANVESGIIYTEEIQLPLLIPRLNLDIDQMSFIENQNIEASECTDAVGRGAPELTFTIDWGQKKLSFCGKIAKGDRVIFSLLLNHAELLKGNGYFLLSDFDLKLLSKKSLIELKVDHFGTINFYSYYPSQIAIESRPLSFKMGPETILKFWMLGDDEFRKEELTEYIAEHITNESGEIEHTRLDKSSLLNEMAQHFTALVRLEKRLFREDITDKEYQLREIRYFLLSENLETIPYYLKNLQQLAGEGAVSNSFFWMVLQIINAKFYQAALNWPYCKRGGQNDKAFKQALKGQCTYIMDLAAEVQINIPGLAEKSEWFTEQISKEYVN